MGSSDEESVNSYDSNIVYLDNHNSATQESSNMFFIEDKGLHFYLLNNLFVTMYFEAFEFFTNSEGATLPQIQCWVHSKPLCEERLDYAKIITLDLSKDKENIWELLEREMLQAINKVFDVYPTGTPLINWSNAVYNYLMTKIISLQHELDMRYCAVILITTDEGPQLFFYPSWADTPVINFDTLTEQYFISHTCKQEITVAREASASDLQTGENAKANVVKRIDPPIEELGDPRDLHNYLLDFGATQQMTPCLADLEDVVEGRKLGVEVADGHIKCPATGKIRISMIDDDGNPIEAILHDVMYVPGLYRRLFSITRFARHGHYAVFRNATRTLHFAPSWARVSLSTPHREQAFVANSTVTEQQEELSEENEGQYHPVPAYWNKESDTYYKRLPLELVHARLGHSKCRTLLAANEHRLWKDTIIRMAPETGCLSCGIATARAAVRNKEHHSGADYPGEYVFLDIQHPITSAGLTPKSTYKFYLIVVDAYSRYVRFYGLRDKSTKAVAEALQQYQADNKPVSSFGYLDLEGIRTDAGTQFTSG